MCDLKFLKFLYVCVKNPTALHNIVLNDNDTL